MSEAIDASPAGDAAAFVAKWRGAWPEWALAEVFVPADQRERVDAWQALQFEWQEAAWRGDESRPGEAKLQWWVEELDGWSKGVRRHPLGAMLHRAPVPWRTIAFSLPSLAASRQRPRDAASARSSLHDVAVAVATVEAALLPGGSTAEAVTAAWLHARLARHPGGAVPATLETPARWAAELLQDWPARQALTPARGIELALARRRLARGDASAPLPPWSALLAGWRGARG